MQKRIKHKSELPNWFNLKNYNDAKNLDAAGWYLEFQIRNRCTFFLDLAQNNDPEDIQIKNRYLDSVRKNPIAKVSSYEELLTYTKNKRIDKSVNYALGVHPITSRQFINIDKSIAQEKRKHLNSWWNQFDRLGSLEENEPRPRLRYKTEAWIDEPLHQSAEFNFEENDIVSVNLRLPDNVLLEHFKNYLAMRRTEIGKEIKRYRQPDFNEWVRFGILPYLDLKIWEKDENISIPHRVMADALFPTGENGEETVRKTTAPLAVSLTHGEQLRILGAQAALEDAEQYIS